MKRSSVARGPRTAEEIADVVDLRAVIHAALTGTPVDDTMLRRSVWTYVSVERHAGTSPGQVIVALTDLIDEAAPGALSARQALTRRVILWCVEAYFGHLGGEVVGRERPALPDARNPGEQTVSNDFAERPFSSVHDPLATPAAIANEPDPFPKATAEKSIEVWHDDWRRRLTRNLSRRSDGRWDPLTHVEGSTARLPSPHQADERSP